MSFIPRHNATVFVLNGHCSNVCIIVYVYVDIYRGPQGRIAYVLIVTPSQKMYKFKKNEDAIEKSVPRDHQMSSLGKPRDANW